MLTTVRCTMPEQHRQRPDFLKAFDADFQRTFLCQRANQPDALKSPSSGGPRSRASGAEVGPHGHASAGLSTVHPRVSHRAQPQKNRPGSSPKLESYLLSEAEYIRTFGY